jgi:hypothetical protein
MLSLKAQDGDVLDSSRFSQFSARLPDIPDSGRDRFPPVRDLLVIVA